MSNFSASGAPPSSAEGKVPAFADAVQRAKEVRPTKKPQFVYDWKAFSKEPELFAVWGLLKMFYLHDKLTWFIKEISHAGNYIFDRCYVFSVEIIRLLNAF